MHEAPVGGAFDPERAGFVAVKVVYTRHTVSETNPTTILCVSSFYKGNRFLQQAKREGVKTVLLTLESLKDEPWARESIDELFMMPSFTNRQDVINAVSYLARTREF